MPTEDPLARAASLDAADPLARFTTEFVPSDEVTAYLDGNSLGRPLAVTAQHLADFVAGEWGSRLIRAWDESWMERPLVLGDRLGRSVLGAAAGQTFIGDSTTVLLYKLIRSAVAGQRGRSEIVIDTENFPTDRYIVESIARETGATIRWLEPDPGRGVTVAEVEAVLSERTALLVVSHIAYKSAFIADVAAITAAAHQVGAWVLWDLCHSAGSVDIQLDADEVDFAVGCSYKYLNGGPGAPAFGFVARRLQAQLQQPITGWMGHAHPFDMGQGYQPADGIRRFISGTPPILAMVPLTDMLDLIDRAGIAEIRAKSVALTTFAIALADETLAPLGVTMASPRDPAVRGGHITLEHPDMSRVVSALWQDGVIPDFRRPQGLRIGLSPLSTTFTEVAVAFEKVRLLLTTE